MSSSLDSRVISSPLAALSMVATSSLEGRDLYFLNHESSHATASAPASHAGSAPPSPSAGPTYMDDLGYHHRKRKCLAADDHAQLPERTWSPKARSPLAHSASSNSERLPSVASWSDHPHQQRGHNGGRDDNPYPSPRLPAILPATSAHPHHSHRETSSASLPAIKAGPRPASTQPISSSGGAGGLASLLNPTNVSSSPPSSSSRSPVSNELYAPAATRHNYGNPMVSSHNHGDFAPTRSSTSPVPSSPGRDSLYGNESPSRAGSVDGGSRPATPTSSGTLHMTPEERRRRRLERNRLAARECRQKKKVYVQELEDRMERMEVENRRLRKEIEELNAKLTLGSMHLDRRGMFEDNTPSSMPPMNGGSNGGGDIRHMVTPLPTDSSTHTTDRSTASPVASLGRESSVPTPPPSHGGSYIMGSHHHQHQQQQQPPSHSVDMLARDLSASPTLPKPIIPLTHGRPHSDSWSSI
ncbi:hypothetical protein BDF22DRAFT_740436 [Syncephalis plumigaleata]|nr:hypothetical protein BDF22DRAFT_740436 [Syncephalis plumigaleata]